MKKNYSSNILLNRLILLFPITTLFQNYLIQINRIIFVFVFILIIVDFSREKFSLNQIFSLLVLVVLYWFSFLFTEHKLDNINDVFYFGFFVIYIIYIVNRKNEFIKYIEGDRKYIKFILLLWSLIVIISIFLPSSYVYNYGQLVFNSTTDSSFRFLPTALFISILNFVPVFIYKEKKYIFLFLMTTFCFFMGTSRTYFAIGLLVIFLSWYLYCFPKNKKIFYFSLIPMVLAIIFFISVSSIGGKIISSFDTNKYLGNIGTITSSRSIFWLADIKAFNNMDVFNRFFGSGYNYIYDVNFIAVQKRIWAHNDFIQLLFNYGYIGAAMYLVIFIKLFSNMRGKKIPLIVLSICFMIWVINASFNMMYVYFCSALSFPILLVVVEIIFTQKNNSINE